MDSKCIKTDLLGSFSYGAFVVCMMFSFAFYLFDDIDTAFYLKETSILIPILITITAIVAICSLGFTKKHFVMNVLTIIFLTLSIGWIINSSKDLRILGAIVLVMNLVLFIALSYNFISNKKNAR